jgi:hypothetical protein
MHVLQQQSAVGHLNSFYVAPDRQILSSFRVTKASRWGPIDLVLPVCEKIGGLGYSYTRFLPLARITAKMPYELVQMEVRMTLRAALWLFSRFRFILEINSS